MKQLRGILTMGGVAAGLIAILSHDAWAHCDTMNGPVVKAARAALERADVRLALVWVRPADEAEIRAAFEKTLTVRSLGTQARALADRFFFETLVRVHRAGEGAPFTGLKESDDTPEPGIAMAEQALAEGSPQELKRELGGALDRELGEVFGQVQATAHYMPEDVDGGRRHVEAYVRYIHFVERLHQAIASEDESHDVTVQAHKH